MPEREENVLIRAVVCGVAGPRQTMSYFPPVTYAKWLDTVRDAEEFIREHTCEGWAWERRIYRVHAGQGRRVRIGTWNPDGPTLLLDPAKPVPAAHCGIIGLQPVKVFDPASAYYATTRWMHWARPLAAFAKLAWKSTRPTLRSPRTCARRSSRPRC